MKKTGRTVSRSSQKPLDCEPRPFTLVGRTVLITGSSKGLGKAMAFALGAAGAKVAINYANGKETAEATYRELLERCQRAGLVPYLGVFKRHRPDPFWLTHAVDGWSFALDFKVEPVTRERLWKLCHELSEVVIAAGGRFYFAKDLVLRPEDARRAFPSDKVERFRALKLRHDPDGVLQTDLWRRVFAAPTR